MLLCMTGSDFWEKNFTHKWGKWTKNRVILNLLESLIINFFWIWSIKKIYINCCILAKMLPLGNIWFLRYEPKLSWPIRLLNFKIDYISRTKKMKKPDFLHFDTVSRKLKVDWKIFGWKWSKIGVDVSQKELNGINSFLMCW